MIYCDNKKALRTAMIIVLVYAFMQILILTIPFLETYFSFHKNPLLPRDLVGYITFPLYFLVPIFSAISLYALQSIRKNQFDKTIVVPLIVGIVLYFIFKVDIYLYIQNHNPYGS